MKKASQKGLSARHFLGLAFAGGLLVGWLLIGWWLWPVQWINTNPWHLRGRYQETYVSLVADSYALDGDIEQVHEALDGWDQSRLADVIATLEAGATNAEESQRLADLRAALSLSAPGMAASRFLLQQKPVIITFALSAVVMVVAVLLTVANQLNGLGLRRHQEEQAQEQPQGDAQPALNPEGVQPDAGDAAGAFAETAADDAESARDKPEQARGDKQDKDQKADVTTVQAAPDQPPDSPQGTLQVVEIQEGAEEAEENVLDDLMGGNDALSGLFDIEEGLDDRLTALREHAQTIEIGELVETSKEIAHSLHVANDLLNQELGGLAEDSGEDF